MQQAQGAGTNNGHPVAFTYSGRAEGTETAAEGLGHDGKLKGQGTLNGHDTSQINQALRNPDVFSETPVDSMSQAKLVDAEAMSALATEETLPAGSYRVHGNPLANLQSSDTIPYLVHQAGNLMAQNGR